MKIERLSCLISAVEHGSLRQAAVALSMAPSALGDQITALEEDLDTPLLVRTTRGVSATEAAQALLPTMRQIVRLEGELRSSAAGLRDAYSGHVRIGSTPALASMVVTPVISAIRRTHARLRMGLTEGDGQELMRAVRDGQIDLALITLAAEDQLPDDLHSRGSTRRPVGVVVSHDHSLAARSGVTWSELREQPLVTVRRGAPLFQLASAALPRVEFAATVESIHRVIDVVSHGGAVGIVPKDMFRDSGADLVWVPIRDAFLFIHVVHLRHRMIPPAATMLTTQLVRRLTWVTRESEREKP